MNRFRAAELLGEGFRAVWSALWPGRCPLCSELLAASGATGLCGPCADTVRPIAPPFCQSCGRALAPETGPPSGVCGFCRLEPPSYDQARAYGQYAGALAQAIREFKFHGKRSLRPVLGELLLDADERWLPDTRIEAIVPVPLHPLRLRERGFNQAVDLARPLERKHRLPLLLDSLIRTRHTDRQIGLSFAARHRNIHGAFAVAKPETIKDRAILLVDDVLTSGATVMECARVLKKAGAETVLVLTLARTT